MSPPGLKTKIFLDSGDPEETAEVLRLLGFLDGQTTNPTLISKNPQVRKRLAEGKKFTPEEIFDFYHQVIGKIAAKIPEGAISIEVYADSKTPSEKLLAQARKMNTWISNAYIKFPTTCEGIVAARQALKEGIRVNMTLCFSQEQAAAVHSATKDVGAKGKIFVSPFVGRLDDRGENGMQLIENILKMYREINSPVEVLTSSVRNIGHFLYALHLGSHNITAPFAILKEWVATGKPLPSPDYAYSEKGLKNIEYKSVNWEKNWDEMDITHELTNQGIARFCQDWGELVISHEFAELQL